MKTAHRAPDQDFTCNLFRCPVTRSYIAWNIAINIVELLYVVLYFFHLMRGMVTLRRYPYR